MLASAFHPIADNQDRAQCLEVPLLAATALALFLSPSGSGAALSRSTCPGIESGRAYHVQTDQFYARRAVGMIEAARSNQSEALSAYVAADTRFELWRGDYNSSARNRGILGQLSSL
jgi:hypothetical protein